MTEQFPIDIAHIISDYASVFSISPWVRDIENTVKIGGWHGVTPRELIISHQLNLNPMAYDELKSDSYIPLNLAKNPADWAFDLIEEKIDHYELTVNDFARNTNPRAIAFIESRIESVTPKCWDSILCNPSAINLIKKYDGIKNAKTPYNIYLNPNDDIWDLVKEHYSTVDNDSLSAKLSFNHGAWAVRLIAEKNIELNFWGLCNHNDPKILDSLIIQHGDELDGYDWSCLSSNPSAIHILKAHPDKIYDDIWSNPAIFEPTLRPGVLDILTELTW